jgi:hypothetical protein
MTERYHHARNLWLALQSVTVKIYENRRTVSESAGNELERLLDELEQAAGLRTSSALDTERRSETK